MRTVSLKGMGGLLLGCSLMTVSLMGFTQSQPAGNAAAKKMKNPVASSPQSIQAGQKAYASNCAPCHGATGKGDGAAAASMQTKPSNLADDKWDHGSTDGEIFVAIRDGIGPKFTMKGYKAKISEPDTWNIVNFLRSLGPKK